MKYLIWFFIALSINSIHYNVRPPVEVQPTPVEEPRPMEYGSIEGLLELNPGTYILYGTEVCAENFVSKEKICSGGAIVNYINNKPGYLITDVPPGDYRVFARYELKKVYYPYTVSVQTGQELNSININPENLYR